MARFHGCLKTPDDPIMAESLSEASGSLEVLEASDEGKKKSKFRAFRSFFGKKKKKGPEDAQEGRKLKPSLSSCNIHISALKPVQEGQPAESRVKSNMGSKALSHDSIFILDPEPEHKIYPSPELPRGRPLQRSYVSRTLPRTRTRSRHGAVSGIVFGTMLPYVPRSAIWAEEYKTTERSSLFPRQSSISPPLIRSDTICKDFEEIFVDEESPKISPKEVSEEILTLKKSSFECSPGPVHSQSLTTYAMITCPSSAQLPIGFSTPASTKGCLDSSAARHKMALNPRKQKKKSLQTTVKPKQEEPDLPLASEEEKRTTKSKEADQKKPKKDSAGASSLEQSKKTANLGKKMAEQATNPDAAGAQGYLSASAYGRQRARKEPGAVGISECGLRGRSFKQSSAFSGPFSLEQSTTPPTASGTPQEVLSDKDGLGKRHPGVDFKAGKASVAQSVPEDLVGDLSPCREGGAPRAKEAEARATLSSTVASAKGCKHSSHTQSERKETSSSKLQGRLLKTESVQDIPTLSREKPASALAKRGVSVARPRLRSLSWAGLEPQAKEAFSDSKSSGEVGDGSEQQVAPRPSVQSLERPEDDQRVFTSPGSSAAEPSPPRQQLASRSPSRALAQPEAEEVSLDSESAPEAGGPGLLTDSKSTSAEEVVSGSAPVALGDPKDKGSRGLHSDADADKFKSADPSQASSEKPKDQPGSPSVSKCALQDWGISVQGVTLTQPPQSFEKLAVEQQVSSDPLRAPAQPSQSAAGTEAEQQTSSTAHLEGAAQEWGLSVEPLLPRTSSKPVLQLTVEQPVSQSPDIATAMGINSEAPEPHSKSPLKPIAVDAIPVGPDCMAVQDSVSKQVLPSRGPFQALLRPAAEDQVSCGAESAVVENNASMQPLVPRLQSPRGPLAQGSESPESAAAEGGASGEPLLPNHAAQSLGNPQSQQISENAVVKEGTSALPPRRGPSQPSGEPKLQAQTLTPASANTSAGSGPEEKTPPTDTSQAWVSPKVEQEASAGPESSAAVEQGITVEPLPSRKPSLFWERPGVEQQAASGSGSAPAAQSTPGEPKPPKSALQAQGHRKSKQAASRDPESVAAEDTSKEQPPATMSSQSPMKPMVKRAVSAGPESVVAKREASGEPLLPRQFARLLAGHKVQQISSNFEIIAAEGAISGKPVPSKSPPQILVRSKVQEMSSRLENKALEGDMPKKSPMPRYPSRSFVKYMAEQVFSESPTAEKGIHADPLSTNPPSKPSMRPKVQFQVFSGQENANMEGGISSQLLPSKGPLQSSGRPEDPKEVSSPSESAPAELSGSKEQPPPRCLSQALGKLEYQQYVSPASESALEGRKSSEDKLPSVGPSQAHVFSTGSASAPVEQSCSERPLPPRASFQAFADPEAQCSVGTTVEGAVPGSNPSGWSVPKGSASPRGTKKHSHGSQDLVKNILVLAAKPMQLTYAPASQTSASGVTCPKEEVVKSSDPNNSHSDVPTTEADVENLFGIRLRKIPASEKLKGEKQDDCTKLSSLSWGPNSLPVHKEHRIKRSASHGFLGTAECFIPGYEFAEKQQGRPKSEVIAGSQPADKVPGEAPGQQAYYSISEPTWITKLTEKQKGSQVPVPTKEPEAKNRATIKEASSVEDIFEDGKQPASIFTSNVGKQEQMAPKKLLEPTKGGLEDEKPFQEHPMRKRILRSSTLPAVFQEPTQSEEPVWFSMAKKKAKAWSHIAEIIQ